MKNILRKLIVSISCIWVALNSYGQSPVVLDSTISPQGGLVIGNSYFPAVSIKNVSPYVVDSVVLSYSVNGVYIGTISSWIPFSPFSHLFLSFTIPFVADTGDNNICVTIDSVEGVATYDTLCVTLVAVPTFVPTYSDDFESGNVGWLPVSTSLKTNWELGAPNYGATNSAHSGTNAWDINLNTSYDTSAQAELYSPYLDFTNVINARLSFWQNRNVEADDDGMRLDYSADGGNTWSALGSVNDTNGINWYSKIISSSGLPAWDSASSGWQQSSYNNLMMLNGNPAPVLFRFVFTSDNNVNYDGVSIDDFSIYICIIVQPVVNNYVTCNGICDGILSVNTILGTPPFTFQWSNGDTTQTVSNLCPGSYIVTVTDLNGCSSFGVVTLPFGSPPLVLTLDSVIASGCGSNDGSFYFSSNSATYTAYVNGVASGSTNNLSPGVYSLYLIDNTCSSDTIPIVVPDSCIDVYPGDANYDLVADNKDLLQIGLAFGNTGPVRPAASITWIAQPCPDWSNWFNIGVNQKHADCDGNGLIDANDTIPVLLNYGLTHPLKPIIIPQINTSAPDLYLVVSQDTAGLSSTINVDVYCGTPLNPIDSIYGIAFSLLYNSALTDSSTAVFNIANTFLGTPGTDIISISKNFASGFADFAITRTDHQNVSGNGLVCHFSIITVDSISSNSSNTFLNFSLSNVTAITANENPIKLDAFGDSIFLDSNLTSINYLNCDKEVKVYPNPANNYFTVVSSLTGISKIAILNQLGEIVYNNEKPQLPQNINVATIPNGVYVLRIETKEGVMHRKIQIIR